MSCTCTTSRNCHLHGGADPQDPRDAEITRLKADYERLRVAREAELGVCEQRCEVLAACRSTNKVAHQEGYIEGLRAYAWWKDGVEYVGTAGQTLEAAIALARK
jgi:hypothetical protein